MSVQPVRIKAKPVPTAARRPLACALAVRFPALSQRAVEAILRLPPGRLRRTLVEFAIREAMTGSLNRRDFDLASAGLAPDVELVPAPQLTAVMPADVAGDESVVRGREAALRFVREWLESWGEFTFALEEVIDLGDGGFLALHHLSAQGASSGIEIGGQQEAEYLQIQQGLIVRIQQWWGWDEALAALLPKGSPA